MASTRISVVITDLDNTLFDWVDIWFNSFTALFERLTADSGIDREELLDEIRAVHQRHGTSEYAFLIEELPSLREKHPDGDLAQIYDAAIHDFRTARKASLKLFPGVAETLKKLKRHGVLVASWAWMGCSTISIRRPIMISHAASRPNKSENILSSTTS
jgi:phosphoglycolate phosphatase-like HAD superfamily hydrolase